MENYDRANGPVISKKPPVKQDKGENQVEQSCDEYTRDGPVCIEQKWYFSDQQKKGAADYNRHEAIMGWGQAE